MELLVYLARRSGQVVSAEELIRVLWHGRVFDDGVVYRKINQLRKALGDDSRIARFIETIPKRGYRLIAPVTVLAEKGDGEGLSAEPVQASVRESAQTPAERLTGASGARAERRRRRRLAFAMIGLVVALALLAGSFLAPRGPASFDVGDDAAVGGRLAGAASQLPAIRPLTFDGGIKLHPRISPDAQKIAFTGNIDDPANLDIYVKAIGPDTGFIRVTDDPAPEFFPTWSPQGDRIAFVRRVPGEGSLSIRTVPWTGGQTQKVVDVAGSPGHLNYDIATLSWSPPDGRYIVYGERPPDTPSRIVQFDLVERKKRVLTVPPPRANAIGDFGPSYSPDGTRIAFVRGPASYLNLDLWLMDADGANARRLTELRMLEVSGVAWTPDGRELLFSAGNRFKFRSYSIRPDEGVTRPVLGLGENDRWPSLAGDRLVFQKSFQEELRLWQVAPRSGADRSTPARDFGIDGVKLVFSPDGARVAWHSTQTGSVQIWVADRDGANARVVTALTDAWDPQWSPDGRLIAFWSYADDGQSDVYGVDPDTFHVRRLTVHEADDLSPTFSRDGRWIYFCSTRRGATQIYKMAVEGEHEREAVAVTRDGGCYGAESRDGRHLYYDAFDFDVGLPMRGPVWRLTLGSEEPPVEVLPGWPRADRSWALADGGIYQLISGDGLAGPDFVLNYFDFTSGTSTELYRGTGARAFYPSVSPDETIVLFAKTKNTPARSELWVIEDFR
jgi:Tol biopolymer transport system component/DNA-binding winged helix-turn-helix (wHTH) protein